MTRIKPIVLVGTALVVCLMSLPAQAEEPTENKGFSAAMGRVTFNRYCASCHGDKADGTGPVARMLKVPPPDLRKLTIENDGEFPSDSVTSMIDGREEIKVHGSRDMPVWGEVFQTALIANPADPDESGEERAGRKVRELVLYIETIQMRPEAAEAPSDER